MVVSFQLSLFPKISSRVQGQVIDKDTKLPIQGAKIQLIFLSISDKYQRNRELDMETITDQNGKFKFDLSYIWRSSAYYLQCEKKGYISLIPDYYFRHYIQEKFPEMTGVFILQEGQIKHFVIELEKGGGLKGTIYKKEASGISPYSNVSGILERKNNPNISVLRDEKYSYEIATLHADENGKFEIEGVEPYDDYYILLQGDGYNIPFIEGIKIEKNVTENIEHIIDLTDQTGIEGFIKIGQDFVSYGYVLMYRCDTFKTPLIKKDYGGCKISNNGYYSCKGLNSGTYLLKYNVNSKDGVQRIGEYEVEVISGTTKTFNINL